MNKLCPRFEIKLVRNGSERYHVDGKTPRISSSSDARTIVSDIVRSAMQDSPAEKFGVITLDVKNRPIGFVIVSEGTLDCSLVHPREVFQSAILQNASAIILVHNHPSGDLTPSNEDRKVTERLTEAGKLLGIQVLDHIIVGIDADSCEWKSLSIRENLL